MREVIHTMGLGTRSLETILEALAAARVKVVVDVRRWGSSARHAQHRADALHPVLRSHGFDVHDLGDLLGGDRPGGFPRHMKTGGFRRGLARLEALAETGAVMLICAESDPHRCHRLFLGAALEERGWRVAHHRATLSERTARGQMRIVRKTG
jgi:ATP-dependent DNA helicase RecQ